MIRIISMAVLVVLLASFSAAAEGVAVIVNKENRGNIDKAMVSKIYLGNLSRWPGGGTIIAYELPGDNPSTASFNSKVIGKSLKMIKDIWAQNVFTGKALPPIVASSDEDVKRAVIRNKSTIGYVKASAADDSVRVVLTVQ